MSESLARQRICHLQKPGIERFTAANHDSQLGSDDLSALIDEAHREYRSPAHKRALHVLCTEHVCR